MSSAVTSTEAIAEAAMSQATAAFIAYLKANKMKPANIDVATKSIADHVNANMLEALADAREAYEAGMTQVMNATFAASFRLAGIAAAKECGVPA